MSEQEINSHLDRLIDAIKCNDKVWAVGMSGGDRDLPKPGEGDIDLFIYCSEIPEKAERQQILAACSAFLDQVNVGYFESERWGHGDGCSLDGVETWLMYFDAAEAIDELDTLLGGDYLWRLENYYYPLGRCAMWQTMRWLYDGKGFASQINQRLGTYPVSLKKKVILFHLNHLRDSEDFSRAVTRKDVFFYHFTLDLALDHFLQVVFALNETYFPSRKRSEQYLEKFAIKPADCAEQLKRVIALGGNPETIEESYSIWCEIADCLISIAEKTLADQE